MVTDERSPYGIAVSLEHRGGPGAQSTIIHPANGTPICSSHWGFVGAVARLLFAPITKESE